MFFLRTDTSQLILQSKSKLKLSLPSSLLQGSTIPRSLSQYVTVPTGAVSMSASVQLWNSRGWNGTYYGGMTTFSLRLSGTTVGSVSSIPEGSLTPLVRTIGQQSNVQQRWVERGVSGYPIPAGTIRVSVELRMMRTATAGWGDNMALFDNVSIAFDCETQPPALLSPSPPPNSNSASGGGDGGGIVTGNTTTSATGSVTAPGMETTTIQPPPPPPTTTTACPRNCGLPDRGGGTCRPDGRCTSCNDDRLRVNGRCVQSLSCKGRRIQSGSLAGDGCRCLNDHCHFCTRVVARDTCRVSGNGSGERDRAGC